MLASQKQESVCTCLWRRLLPRWSVSNSQQRETRFRRLASNSSRKQRLNLSTLFLNSYSPRTYFFQNLSYQLSYNYNISVGFSWRDYTIIEELGVGVNKFLLSNESVLQAPPANASLRPAEIFNNITLIANCHKKESTHHSGRGYTVEAKRVIFYPVHNLLRANMKDTADVIKTFTEFNEAIWEALKEGNVFVHCLAGVHRAACVAVSHYLWRYYKLGHKHLSADVPAIYESLASRRPGVVALSYLSLVRVWEEHLRKQTQQWRPCRMWECNK